MKLEKRLPLVCERCGAILNCEGSGVESKQILEVEALTPDINNLMIVNNEAEQRFEAKVNNQIAVLEYERSADGSIAFTHTGVPPEIEGRGIANKLTRAGLDYARDNQLTIVPLCQFVVSYIRKHPEYQNLVDPKHRTRVQ